MPLTRTLKTPSWGITQRLSASVRKPGWQGAGAHRLSAIGRRPRRFLAASDKFGTKNLNLHYFLNSWPPLPNLTSNFKAHKNLGNNFEYIYKYILSIIFNILKKMKIDDTFDRHPPTHTPIRTIKVFVTFKNADYHGKIGTSIFASQPHIKMERLSSGPSRALLSQSLRKTRGLD